jgi:hypothetical protein
MPAETTPPDSAQAAAPEAETSRPSSALTRWVPAPLRLWNWSFPSQVALLSLLLLLILWGMAVWWQFRNPNLLPWTLSQHWSRPLAVCLLTALIPLLVFLCLRWWLTPVRSSEEDLDSAWSLGVEALTRRGVALGDRPLILVLGSTGAIWEQALFDHQIAGFPQLSPLLKQRKLALQWYLAPEVIVVAARQVGCLGALNARLAPRFDLPDDDARERPLPRAAAGPRAPETPPADSLDVAQSLPLEVSRRQGNRIAFLGELLRGARSPRCGLNGVLTLVPFPDVCYLTNRAEAHGAAIRDDLRALSCNLDLRFPVVCLLTEIQRESGFPEVMRRTGSEATAIGRLGRRYDLGLLAGRTELERFARILRNELEVRIYRLFGHIDVLKRPGNRDLFGLLCRTRSQIARPLTQLLTTAFSELPSERPEEIPFYFAGCYVAATGRESDQRAFGPALLPRLLESQDHVEWTRAGLARGRSHRRWQVLGGLAFVLLLGLLLWQLLASSPRGAD